ncbi:hypothetical protein ACRWQM_10150 [Shewanella sp. HL-SH5]|uniref:hypothetical protein n=1 Tax=Shewanella sp. HL-SH5 TaxID=3436241 RepID=UPI003EC0D1D1
MTTIIRFTRPWAGSISPITIRFGDDEPPTPIDTMIGIECGLYWVGPSAIESQTILVESASVIEINNDTIWFTHDLTDIRINLSWSFSQLITVIYGVQWDTTYIVNSDINNMWVSTPSYETQVNLNWFSESGLGDELGLIWVNQESVGINVTLDIHTGVTVDDSFTLIYNYPEVTIGDNEVKWSVHSARWICSTDYRPPKVGVIKIRFKENYVNTASPALIRFTPSPEYCYFDDGGGLIDSNPVLPNLDFKTPIEPQLRRYYLMQPTITCIRVSDNVPIVISNISISRSRGQWASSVSIDFSSRIDASRAENQLLKVGINGYEFYVLLEQTSVSKVFGNATYRGTGRSRSAELTTPYVLPISYTNSTSRSFAGLLSDMLQFTGWTIELNGIVDFNVPAGAFSVGNKSPIDAVQEAVTQLGCMLLSNDEAKALTVVPRWPTVPWLMDAATPDLTLHDAVITSYSESKEIGTECNVVWLRGEQQGISAKVKRAGTAGNIATDDISAQLIVDNQAARTAGTNALADTGNKLNINMSLPILADLPPATPGMLIGIREGVNVFKGTCDSVTISASVSDTGDIDVEQTITVVRHVA